MDVSNCCLKAVICSIFLLALSPLMAQDTLVGDSLKPKPFSIRGYIKDMPSLTQNSLLDNPDWNNVLTNRLNFRYNLGNSAHVAVEVRNRLLSGDLIGQHWALMQTILEDDAGTVDASFVPLANKHLIWHTHFDRFYVDYQKEKWQIRAGRQRINWGINMVTNPNDLFNNFSYFDFDYEERPGADAVRLQYFRGNLSRLEFAANPRKKSKESVAAFLYAFNKKKFDIQLIAGYYRHRTALGAGWAGSIKNMGFKGEVSLFNNIDHPDTMNAVAAVSFDYMFPAGYYGIIEFLYNGGHKSPADLLQLSQPMSADNIFVSKYAVTASLMYPFSPVLSSSLAAMYMPDMDAFYVMPNVTRSLSRNLDFSLVAQYFFLRSVSNLSQLSVFASCKWSF